MLAKILGRLTGWDKHPENVWFIAGPLAALGLTLGLVRSVLQWTLYRDPWFLVIFVAINSLGAVAFFKLWKTYRRFIP